jgi:chaperonin GroEL (HSP60 family)
MAVASEQMDSDAVDVDEERLLGVAETALTGKGTEAAIDIFAPMVRDALTAVEESVDKPGAEHVAMFKIGSGGLRDSYLIRGVAIRRRVLMDSLPNDLVNARTVVIGGDVKIRKMTRTAEIQITSAEQLDGFVEAESERKSELAKALIDSGANLILAGGEIDRDILHDLADAKILAVPELDESELENAAAATGATVLDSVLDIEASDLGLAGSVRWERRQATDQVEDIITIDDCNNPGAVTLAIGGAGETATEEIIRGLHDHYELPALLSKTDNCSLEEGPHTPELHMLFARLVRTSRGAHGWLWMPSRAHRRQSWQHSPTMLAKTRLTPFSKCALLLERTVRLLESRPMERLERFQAYGIHGRLSRKG